MARYDQQAAKQALTALFCQHPGPWSIKAQGLDCTIADGDGDTVTTFDPDEVQERIYHQGLVAAVNTAHGVLRRLPEGGPHAA